jgi:hypothetical protein
MWEIKNQFQVSSFKIGWFETCDWLLKLETRNCLLDRVAAPLALDQDAGIEDQAQGVSPMP